MNYADQTPTLSAGDFRQLRANLAALGVELAGDAQFRYSKDVYRHNIAVPHVSILCDRVGDLTPDYTVCGFAECVACKRLMYLDARDVAMYSRGDVLGFCRQCEPGEFGSPSAAGFHGFEIPKSMLSLPPHVLRDYMRAMARLREVSSPGDLL